MVDAVRTRPFAVVAALALAACKGPPRDASVSGGDGGAPHLPSAAPSGERFTGVIRPILGAHGCDATPCHGAFKGGGFFLPGGADPRDYPQVLAQIDPAHPSESKLWKKAVGLLPHNGGQNLAPGECDARWLLAWIGGEPDPPCGGAPPANRAVDSARFARTVAPGLRALGCAKASCHGGEARAQARLDLASLTGSGPYDAALASFERTATNRIVPWKSAVLMAAWGEGARGHVKADLASCAYRRLHGFVARAPEAACDLDAPPRQKLDDLVSTVVPSLLKRGCAAGTCHGGAPGRMALFDPANDRHAGVHDYVMLTARMEPGEPLERTTLLRKARNDEPHGGGKRLGGEGDCRDAMLVDWASGRPVRPCAPRPAPSFERFAAEVQPVLEKMTCTRAPCHGEGRRIYHVAPHPDAPALALNFRETVAQIDPDFAPLSEVMLRMREPCAYAVVTAWIEGTSKPACTVQDPDPGSFPRLDDPGAMHP
jgi:hypothetical protein